jgi:murein L,D-transpeptidase YafK
MKFKKIMIILLIPIIAIGIYYYFPDTKFTDDKRIDKIKVYKSKRELQVFCGSELLKTYKIALGRVPAGRKEFEGDKKTPEGLYYIDGKNPNSSYHKNLGISYPNKTDMDNAQKVGKSPGGLIKIHGLRNGADHIGKFHRWSDWTLGCIAVTNSEIDELYKYVPIGTPIEIFE